MLPPDVVPSSYQNSIKSTPQCESFMHLHLAFDAKVRPKSTTCALIVPAVG